MDSKLRIRVMSGLLLVLAVIAGVVWSTNRPGAKPPPTPGAAVYYTGPMRGKTNRDVYATEDGRKVPPPEGASSAAGERKAPSSGPTQE